MDYDALTSAFMRSMLRMRRSHPHRAISRAVQGERQVLHCIAEEGARIRPSDISQRMGISTARIAATLNALEAKGWVTRQIDPADRRRILVALTQAGRDQAEETNQAVRREVCRMLKALGDQDASDYVRILGRLVDQMAEQPGQGQADMDTEDDVCGRYSGG